MAITRTQQYKQMLQDGGRIGLKPGGPPGGGDPGMTYNAPNPREDRRGGQYTSPEAKAVVTRQELKDLATRGAEEKAFEPFESLIIKKSGIPGAGGAVLDATIPFRQ